MLLLADAAEEGRDPPLQIAAQQEVVLHIGTTLTGVYFQGQCCLITGRQLGAAGEMATLDIGDSEVLIAFLQKDKFLAIVLNDVIPVHNSIIVVHFHLPPYFRTEADPDRPR